MINKKVSILAGLFLSLVAGTSMAAEKAVTDGKASFPRNTDCSKYLPDDGEYTGKLVYAFAVDGWGYNWYWFVSLDSDGEGCVAVDKTSARHDRIAYDAFNQSSIVKIKLNKNRITTIIQ
ncbi:hypothetical protein [Xenorhabdus sp. PB62.4]|uniref:hypothetical protein n=1 Tax=Xenorhabdus sp. PB62.4 TaxID=1851573 RepID=UPI00165697AB|nr:hypothetical protein [Xenorhabdus sp. PB62.4]MBC8954661.1 hypothetical protein [Xenorhabdus sp. PB62.4]